jgi:hypothetical protein
VMDLDPRQLIVLGSHVKRPTWMIPMHRKTGRGLSRPLLKANIRFRFTVEIPIYKSKTNKQNRDNTAHNYG